MKCFKQFIQESAQDSIKVGDKIRVIRGNMMSGVVTKIDGNYVYFDHATAKYQTVWSGAKDQPKQYAAHISNVVKEDLNEQFSKDQLTSLKKEYETLEKMDVTSDSYKKLIKLLNALPQDHLKSLADADIKFVSKLAKNRLKESVDLEERCWDGYKPTPGKKPYEKGSCMKEGDEIQEDSEKDGKDVSLNKPFRTPDGPKKFAVYVKNDKGNVVKVTFGDPDMEIKRDSDERRANFRARHNCDAPGPKDKARYWSCKMWSNTPVSKITEAYDFKELSGPKTKKVVGGIINITGNSPEDALKRRMVSHGYNNVSIELKGGVYSVKCSWGAASSSETFYYELSEGVDVDVSSAAKLFQRFLRSTGAPDKGTKLQPKTTSTNNSVFVGTSMNSKFDYVIDLSKRTVTATQSHTMGRTHSYVWNDKTGEVKMVEGFVIEAAPPDGEIEKWINDNKARFKSEYGEDKGEKVLYAKAWSMYNKK